MITEREVRVDQFRIHTFGRAAEEVLRVLQELGYWVSPEAEEIIRRVTPTSGETHQIAVVRSESFMDPSPTTKLCQGREVVAFAREQGYEPASIEDGWILREALSYIQMRKLGDRVIIMIMHEPVVVNGEPRVLVMQEGVSDDMLITRYPLDPDTGYGSMWGFAYRAKS